jgi:hypothetical protein
MLMPDTTANTWLMTKQHARAIQGREPLSKEESQNSTRPIRRARHGHDDLRLKEQQKFTLTNSAFIHGLSCPCRRFSGVALFYSRQEDVPRSEQEVWNVPYRYEKAIPGDASEGKGMLCDHHRRHRANVNQDASEQRYASGAREPHAHDRDWKRQQKKAKKQGHRTPEVDAIERKARPSTEQEVRKTPHYPSNLEVFHMVPPLLLRHLKLYPPLQPKYVSTSVAWPASADVGE